MRENPTLTLVRRGPPDSEYLHEVLRQKLLGYKHASSTGLDRLFFS